MFFYENTGIFDFFEDLRISKDEDARKNVLSNNKRIAQINFSNKTFKYFFFY